MKKHIGRILILVLLASIFLNTPSLDACTTFCIESGDQLVFGRNYDWGIGVGLVIVNKKNLSKKALILTPTKPMEWISKYGSITFNQYGKELPMGGINEAGLVIELMLLSGSRFPIPDNRPTLRELAWIQFQLDTSQSVDDVIASDSKVRIHPDSVPIHFLVCDKTGQVATIEFINGKMVVHRGKGLPFAALANSTYEESMRYLRQFRDFGGDKMISKSVSSLDRFSRAVQGIHQYGKNQSGGIVDYAFKILDDVSQGPGTKWSIVYDIKKMAIHFKTAKFQRIKILKVKDFDFSGAAPSRVLDINTPKAGEVGPLFIDYCTEINRKLIFESWKNTAFLKDTPDETLNKIAEYPESIHFKPETLSNKK